MNKYLVTLEQIEIEANSEEEAWVIAATIFDDPEFDSIESIHLDKENIEESEG